MDAHPSTPPIHPQAEAPKPQYGTGWEAQAVHAEIGTFDYRNSAACAAILEYFGPSVRLRELKGIVFLAPDFLRAQQNVVLPKVPRNAKRNFPLLVRFVDQHLDVLRPVIAHIRLLDDQRVPIKLLDSGQSLRVYQL
jgi:hypothetical protein